MKQNAKILYQRQTKLIELFKNGWYININESPEQKQARITKAKHNFAFFVKYYFPHYTLDEQGQQIATPEFHIQVANKILRKRDIKIFLRWGRGLGKSVLADLIIPLWLYINNQISYMVLIGNNYDKAQILLSDLQFEFQTNYRLQYDFSDKPMRGSWEKGYFITETGFVAKAVGMGQDTRGLRSRSRRPDYIVADDLEDKNTLLAYKTK